MPVCDRNCFVCKYEDCICDDEITPEERATLERIDAVLRAVRDGKPVPKPQEARKLTYYERNRDRVLQKAKERREKDPEGLRIKERANYHRNAEKIKARVKEYQERNPEKVQRWKDRRREKKKEEKLNELYYNATGSEGPDVRH